MSAKPRGDCNRSLVVETHPVDHRAVGDQSKQSRFLTTRLRDRGDRAHLDVTESEAPETAYHLTVLIETCSDPERRFEPQPQGCRRE